MKFRAVMTDTGPMREFTNIVATISRISKECIFRLSEEYLYFIISEETGPAPPTLWCVIPQKSYFSEYNMIGVDEEHKDIYLGFTSANLARSLSTLKQSAKSIKMKLTKKHCPCLTLEIEVPSSGSMQTRHVTHDIPLAVVPRRIWSEYKEPTIPELNVSLELPPLKQLKLTIDRMKAMSTDVLLKVTSDGRLTLQIETDMAKVSTRFQNLVVESYKGPSEQDDNSDDGVEEKEDNNSSVHCLIDIKKLSMFLSADQISHNKTVCSVIHKKLVILCLATLEDVKFQCFIPGICY